MQNNTYVNVFTRNTPEPVYCYRSGFTVYEERFLEGMLIPGENVIACFKSVRDGVIFTNKRVIAFNVQGITGKKTDYTSLPYKRVQAFSIETAGVVDLDSELHLWFSSVGRVRFEFARGVDVKKLSTYIADDIL